MDFQPINSDHAVQSATFSILFDGIISPSAIQGLRGRRDIIAELPAIQTPEGMELKIAGPAMAPAQRRVAGVQLSHLRPDGTPAWALSMMLQQLAVECTRYTRWNRVWETSHRYLRAGLDMIANAERPRRAVMVGHAVVDTFVASGENYALRSLLKENRLIASSVFSAGPTWHNHIGWYAPQSAQGSHWLNQLNVDAMREAPNSSLVVRITHNQELRFAQPIEISAVGLILNDRMNELHANNKSVLNELLSSEMAKTIGLDPQ